jgi:signal transduction histidine kinase
MRVSIKAKQIAGVTVIVGVAVVALSGLYVTRLAGVVLNEAHGRGQLLSNAIIHRAREVVPESPDVRSALATDAGLRSILEASIYGESITDAAIVDTVNIVIASSDTIRVDTEQRPRADLAALLGQSRFAQLSAIYAGEGQTLDIRQPITLGTEAFGSIVIGVSTLLMRQELDALLRPAIITAGVSLLVAVIVAGILAQLLLRPIHVIRSGLTRLGKGEFGATVDLPPGDEFGDLGEYFNAVSRQLHAERGTAAQAAVDPKRLLESTLAYSRKLVALNRLTAGIAHEVKNPLNAMMIHLELLRTKIRKGALAPVGAAAGTLGLAQSDPEILQHVEIIEGEVRRLDEVVQGFLKFTRPDELKLQPVSIGALFQEILPVVEPEAHDRHVKVLVDAPLTLPEVNGDAAMLRQAFLNLAINACQAMPNGGTLRLVAAPATRDTLEVRVEDTGVGIPPDHLGKIFDLYFTTKDHGTGIGLSMVYRIIQMHDGDVEVQSTPGVGTTFKIHLPRASE